VDAARREAGCPLWGRTAREMWVTDRWGVVPGPYPDSAGCRTAAADTSLLHNAAPPRSW
jgi:hypothetical protein